MDDLMTSQPTRGLRFPNFEMLDARVASALKRIISNPYFGRRISVEEQKAPTQYRFHRGRQIAQMIYELVRVAGAHEAALDLTYLFSVSLQGDDIQDFDTGWKQDLLSADEIPKENVLESLYKMRLRESVQLQTAFAMYCMNKTWINVDRCQATRG